MARSVSGGAPPPSRAPQDHFKPLRRNDLRDPPLSVGATAPPPVRNQGPGRSLPGLNAGHPLQGAGSHEEWSSQSLSAEVLAYALLTRVPEMSPNVDDHVIATALPAGIS
jgi:hypothetical protein